MQLRETAAVLAMISALDGRKAFGEIDATAWHAVVGDLRFDDCREAVIGHYQESSHPLMPSDLRSRVRAIRKARIGDRNPPLPPVDPDDTERYLAWQQAWTKALGDGLTDIEAERNADSQLGVIRKAVTTQPRDLNLEALPTRKP